MDLFLPDPRRRALTDNVRWMAFSRLKSGQGRWSVRFWLHSLTEAPTHARLHPDEEQGIIDELGI